MIVANSRASKGTVRVAVFIFLMMELLCVGQTAVFLLRRARSISASQELETAGQGLLQLAIR